MRVVRTEHYYETIAVGAGAVEVQSDHDDITLAFPRAYYTRWEIQGLITHLQAWLDTGSLVVPDQPQAGAEPGTSKEEQRNVNS